MMLQGPRDMLSSRLGRRETACDFYARVIVFDGIIEELDVFTWELDPLGTSRRTCREWIEEHLHTDIEPFFERLEINGEGAWEATFCGSISGHWYWTDCGDEYDEEIEITDFLSQQLPIEWFTDDYSFCSDNRVPHSGLCSIDGGVLPSVEADTNAQTG